MTLWVLFSPISASKGFPRQRVGSLIRLLCRVGDVPRPMSGDQLRLRNALCRHCSFPVLLCLLARETRRLDGDPPAASDRAHHVGGVSPTMPPGHFSPVIDRQLRQG